MTEAINRFAAEVEQCIDDAKRRGADRSQMEQVLQIAAQDMREEAAGEAE